jgi:hypothetical protein
LTQNKRTPGELDNRIVFLFEDSQTNLCVGTETAGTVLIKHDGQVSNLGIGRGSRGQRLRFACEDSTGAVRLNLADGGVVRCRGTNVAALNASASSIISEKSGPVLKKT